MLNSYAIKEVRKLQNFLAKAVVDNNKQLKEWKERKNKMSYFQFLKNILLMFLKNAKTLGIILIEVKPN